MATQSEVESHLIKSWACFKRDEVEDAASFAEDARDGLQVAVEDGWDSPPADCPPVPRRLRFKDWRIANPSRWFRRDKSCPSESHTIVEPEPSTEAKRIMKKIIGLIVISGVVGAASNYFTDPFSGPTSVVRGQFSAVSQCESCATIRLAEVRVCADCGETEAIDRIAAPLSTQYLGGMYKFDAGWQFKDGSTLFDSEGEYVVPELVVIKTMRM